MHSLGVPMGKLQTVTQALKNTMPNHVKNIVRIVHKDGKKASEIAEKLKDFNEIKRMPAELRWNQSPTVLISQEEFDKQEADWNAKTPEEQEEVKKRHHSRQITRAMSVDLKRRFGADNWYEWSYANWGTKWGSYEVEHEQGSNVIEFQTAWSTPTEIIEELSRQYPEATVSVKYADEDLGNNCGEY